MNISNRPDPAGSRPTATPRILNPAGGSVTAGDGHAGKLEAMLGFSVQLMAVGSSREAGFCAVNEIGKLVRCRQAFLFAPRTGYSGPGKAMRLRHASALSSIDPNAPLVRELEALVAGLIADASNSDPDSDAASPLACRLSPDLPADLAYPYAHGLLVPVRHPARPVRAFLLLARETMFTAGEKVIAGHAGAALGQALAVFETPGTNVFGWMRRKPVKAGAALLALAAMALPVPLAVLAPAEVVARDPVMVASPIDGVIRSIAVEPNSVVSKGDLLFDFVDTDLAGELEIANRAVSVAAARLRMIEQGAFGSPEMRREMAIAEAELATEMARRDRAQARSSRSVVLAPAGGVAVFNRKDDWIGKPVSTGEWVMQIADPASTELRMEVAIGDAAGLDGDGSLRVFFDSDPLRPLQARIESKGLLAEPTAGQGLAYPVTAAFDAGDKAALPSIGSRGTAQIYGPRVSLGFYLFRRPIALLRQRFGL